MNLAIMIIPQLFPRECFSKIIFLAFNEIRLPAKLFLSFYSKLQTKPTNQKIVFYKLDLTKNRCQLLFSSACETEKKYNLIDWRTTFWVEKNCSLV